MFSYICCSCFPHPSLPADKDAETEVDILAFSLETLPLPTPAAALSVQLSIMTVKLQPNGVCAAAPVTTICLCHVVNSLLSCIFVSVTLLWRLSEATWSSVLWSGLSHPCSWERSHVKFPKQPLLDIREKWYQKLTPYGSARWLKQVHKRCYYRKPVWH